MKDSKLKQRLIGAVVLIILVVIFVPMLLDEPREAALKTTNIPPQPEGGFSSKVTPLDEPTARSPTPVVITDENLAVIVDRNISTNTAGESSESVPPPAASEPAPLAPVEEPASSAELTVPDQAPEAEAPALTQPAQSNEATTDRLAVSSWVVQLGSFSSEQNALKLRDQLRAKGYTTFVEAVDAKGAKVFRVRIGPELDRLRAEAIREKLEKELKIKGIVGRYAS